MDDLADWLTQIWDEQEKAAREDLEIVALARLDPEYTLTYQWSRQMVNANGIVVSSMFSPGAPTPTEMLARIAADRQILALHQPWSSPPAQCHTCVVRGKRTPSPWPCPTVRLLAQPYADREGFRDEWRVEQWDGIQQAKKEAER